MPSNEALELLESVLNESKKEKFDINKIKITLSDLTSKAINAFKHAASVIKQKVVKKNKDESVKEAASNITKKVSVVSSLNDLSCEVAKKVAELYQQDYTNFGLDCDITVSDNKIKFNFLSIVQDIYNNILEEEKQKNSKLYQVMKSDKGNTYKAIYWKLVYRYIDTGIKPFFNVAFGNTELLTPDTIQNPGKNTYNCTYKFEDDFKNCVCTIVIDSNYQVINTVSSKREAAMILIEALNTLLNE